MRALTWHGTGDVRIISSLIQVLSSLGMFFSG